MITANNVWFTSDTHYSHVNICRSTTRWGSYNETGKFFPDQESTRDFSSVESMNDAIVNGINSTVDEKDFLIHLGDWSFGGFEKIQEFRDRINCKNIVLILGNHDHHIQKDRDNVKKLFTHVTHYEELNVKKLGSFVLCHYPIISWNGTYMLHGHQHLKGDSKFGEGKRMDIGLDGSPDFRPYHIEEIAKILNGRSLEK